MSNNSPDNTKNTETASPKAFIVNKTNPLLTFKSLSLIAILAFSLLAIAWYIAGGSARYRSSIAPQASFSLPQIEAPDYTNTKSWALFPDQKPAGAWETPWGVDVFFIHGTTSDNPSGWNIAISDQDAAIKLKSEMLPSYAGPFLKMAPVYAPYYRQATLHAEYSRNESSKKALSLAYSDVESAFKSYLEEQNQGRAIIIAGVGQGGLMAKRLLKDHFNSKDMQERLVIAYLIETPTSAAQFPANANGLQPCENDEQLNCIASWNTIHENDASRAQNILSRALTWTDTGAIEQTADEQMLCFNPSMGNNSSELIPAKLHRGSSNGHLLNESDDAFTIENAISSQCVDGFLVVSKAEDASLKTTNSEANRLFTPSYNLFYSDVLYDAAKRARIASAWLDKNAAKPAPPFPPIERIEIAPIKKIEKILGTE